MMEQRYGAQLGPLDSILHTSGRFLIRTSSKEIFDTALQVSRNLFQYFAADSEIVDLNTDAVLHQGNVISVALGPDLPESVPWFHSINVLADHGLVVRKHNGQKRVFQFEEGLGAIFLRPLPLGRLELVIWGYESCGLGLAARLVPMLTGLGQPEFVIVGKRCAWEGAAGAHAMGSFDNFWSLSESSFVG